VTQESAAQSLLLLPPLAPYVVGHDLSIEEKHRMKEIVEMEMTRICQLEAIRCSKHFRAARK